MAIVRVTIKEENLDESNKGFKWRQNTKYKLIINQFIVGDAMMNPNASSGLAVKIRTILAGHGLRVRNVEDW